MFLPLFLATSQLHYIVCFFNKVLQVVANSYYCISVKVHLKDSEVILLCSYLLSSLSFEVMASLLLGLYV